MYKMLNENWIDVWLDGGWGVDALLGEQTRLHEDLDIVIQQKDVPRLRELLGSKGYKDVPRDDTRECNFVLGDDKGREVDVHVVVFDKEGNGIYGPIDGGVMYPTYAFGAMGKIHGESVRCLSPEYQVVSHTGYKLREKDRQDVKVLCEKFDIEPPVDYKL
jgi:lincosamide nucleotidyltransferase A/C/D/E